MPLAHDFDEKSNRFTRRMVAVANWKHQYVGAAYSTRLRAAIADAKEAIAEVEEMLARDGAAGPVQS